MANFRNLLTGKKGGCMGKNIFISLVLIFSLFGNNLLAKDLGEMFSQTSEENSSATKVNKDDMSVAEIDEVIGKVADNVIEILLAEAEKKGGKLPSKKEIYKAKLDIKSFIADNTHILEDARNQEGEIDIEAAAKAIIQTQQEDTNVAVAEVDILNIDTALHLYNLDNGKFPTTEQGLAALIDKPTKPPYPSFWGGPYLTKLNQDPWGNPYIYRYPGKEDDYDLFSRGPDGVESDDDIYKNNDF